MFVVKHRNTVDHDSGNERLLLLLLLLYHRQIKEMKYNPRSSDCLIEL
jgi:hypothetical protein